MTRRLEIIKEDNDYGMELDGVHIDTRHPAITTTQLKYAKILSFSSCGLEEIDLQGLQENVRLTALDLTSNHLSNLDLRPLSSCISLQVLLLGDNQLEHVDLQPLGSCRLLRALDLSRNDLMVIDLTPLAVLERLTWLQISGNKGLSAIDLTPLKSLPILGNLSVPERARVMMKGPPETMANGFDHLLQRIEYL